MCWWLHDQLHLKDMRNALCLRKQSHAYTYMYSENAYDVSVGSYYKIHVILRCIELEFFKNIEK